MISASASHCWRPDPTKLTLGLLVGSWAIVRAIAGATIAVTTRADQPWWLATLVFVVTAGVLGAVLSARSSGPLHDTVVTVGRLALLEGTRDVAEGALRARHAHGLRRVGHARSGAAAFTGAAHGELARSASSAPT